MTAMCLPSASSWMIFNLGIPKIGQIILVYQLKYQSVELL